MLVDSALSPQVTDGQNMCINVFTNVDRLNIHLLSTLSRERGKEGRRQWVGEYWWLMRIKETSEVLNRVMDGNVNGRKFSNESKWKGLGLVMDMKNKR